MSTRYLAAAAALTWLGTPYRHQASRIGVGCDCLGLVRGVWQDLYGNEPEPTPPYRRSARDAAGAGALLVAANNHFIATTGPIEPGMLLLFKLLPHLPPRHCGILVAPDRFVHAQERLGVVTAPFDDNWRRKLHSSYNFPEMN